MWAKLLPKVSEGGLIPNGVSYCRIPFSPFYKFKYVAVFFRVGKLILNTCWSPSFGFTLSYGQRIILAHQ